MCINNQADMIVVLNRINAGIYDILILSYMGFARQFDSTTVNQKYIKEC
jgi:hypothetical protein